MPLPWGMSVLILIFLRVFVFELRAGMGQMDRQTAGQLHNNISYSQLHVAKCSRRISPNVNRAMMQGSEMLLFLLLLLLLLLLLILLLLLFHFILRQSRYLLSECGQCIFQVFAGT